MRLFISLPVLIVVLAMALEGPAPAQVTPDLSSTFENLPDKLKEFGNTLEDKSRAATEHIKQKEFLTKTQAWISETLGKMKEKIKKPHLPEHLVSHLVQQGRPHDVAGPSSYTNKKTTVEKKSHSCFKSSTLKSVTSMLSSITVTQQQLANSPHNMAQKSVSENSDVPCL
ncbi:Apolipoprotein C-I [Microtus ochrogaster]|uniref:Apolipoprotein C-I n=1 Tax=Microtus ochrogaster TaxID=79684 RepID=A0A8J6KSC1_MICOH|nr:Apolipoprotein C-I [Microtus ochrogaster]